MADERSLWDLLAQLVEERQNIMVDQDGVIERLGELDELEAAKHVKRLIVQWGNRRRGGRHAPPLEGQTSLPITGDGEPAAPDSERGADPPGGQSQEPVGAGSES